MRIHCYEKPYTCGNELGAKGIALLADSFEEFIAANAQIALVCNSVGVLVIGIERDRGLR